MSTRRRTLWLVIVGVLAAASLLFMVGVFAGWWPYLWWEAFG